MRRDGRRGPTARAAGAAWSLVGGLAAPIFHDGELSRREPGRRPASRGRTYWPDPMYRWRNRRSRSCRFIRPHPGSLIMSGRDVASVEITLNMKLSKLNLLCRLDARVRPISRQKFPSRIFPDGVFCRDESLGRLDDQRCSSLIRGLCVYRKPCPDLSNDRIGDMDRHMSAIPLQAAAFFRFASSRASTKVTVASIEGWLRPFC
jgi:hypothetical protein